MDSAPWTPTPGDGSSRGEGPSAASPPSPRGGPRGGRCLPLRERSGRGAGRPGRRHRRTARGPGRQGARARHRPGGPSRTARAGRAPGRRRRLPAAPPAAAVRPEGARRPPGDRLAVRPARRPGGPRRRAVGGGGTAPRPAAPDPAAARQRRPAPGDAGPVKAALAVDRMRRAAPDHPATATVLEAWGRSRGPAAYRLLCHGDFHLGQLVRAPRSGAHAPWRLIDIDDLGLGDPAWDLARPAAWFAAGLLPSGIWSRFLGAYQEAGGPAVGADPWERLDVPARALTVQTAALALAKSTAEGGRSTRWST
ncbi:phosphotransferase [Streptomyces diastatochromogenes]|nr:phosphotransferase [Streptomyces diastatochromogenes]